MPYVFVDYSDGRFTCKAMNEETYRARRLRGEVVSYLSDGAYAAYLNHLNQDEVFQDLLNRLGEEKHG